MPAEIQSLDKCRIEQLPSGVLLVRVQSGEFNGQRLPDAVFTFRNGEPQYDRWLKRYYEQNARGPETPRIKRGGKR